MTPVEPKPPIGRSAAESLAHFNLRYLAIVFCFVALASAILFSVSRYYLNAGREDEVSRQRLLIAQDIGHLLRFYTDTVENIANQTLVSDLLVFGDRALAHTWALQTSNLLPKSLGLALVMEDGTVMGDPIQLNLGQQCRHYISDTLRGGNLNVPPVHADVEGLEHFDIAKKVFAEGEQVGMVFASFSLELLQQRIDSLVMTGESILIKDGEGGVIAHTGTGSPAETLLNQEAITIPGSGWKLYMQSALPSATGFSYVLAIVGVLVFSGLGYVIVLMSRRLGRVFQQDINLIHDRLSALKLGFRMNAAESGSGFKETQQIVEQIGTLVDEIDHYQVELKNLSATDDLTGLFNRRGFFERASYVTQVANRGVPCALVLFDLDHFKACNDRYGHECGDQVLKLFADTLKRRVRGSDVCARFGGDEFAVILVNLDQEAVIPWYHQVAEAFVEEQKVLMGQYGISEPCTLSSGAISMVNLHCRIENLMRFADEQLYKVKQSGRGDISLRSRTMSCDDCDDHSLQRCRETAL